MKLKSIIPFMALLLPAVPLAAGEDDPLHNRTFTAGLTEIKNGTVAKKVISDVIRFKNGKLQTEFLKKKFGYSWIRYRINKDSVYTDHTDTEVRLLEIEASATDEVNQTVYFELTVLEWDIDGLMKITKNDKLRRYYDLAGREKGGKPKKEKKKQEDILN